MQLELGADFHQLCFIQAFFGQSFFGIHFRCGNLEILLGVLPSSIAGAKFSIDLSQTGIHKLIGLKGFLVFLIIGTLIVSLHQMIDKVETAQQALILQGETQNVHDLLGRRFCRKTLDKAISRFGRRQNRHLQCITALESLGLLGGELILGQGQRACLGLNGSRQRCKGLRGEVGLLFIFLQPGLHLIAITAF